LGAPLAATSCVFPLKENCRKRAVLSLLLQAVNANIQEGTSMRIRKVIGAICIVAFAVFSICFAYTSPASAGNHDFPVKVMTRNMYPGADIAAVAVAADPIQAIQDTIDSVIQSEIPARAALVAAEIARNKPDLVAIQEAAIWRIETGSGTIVLDQLDLLLNWLRLYGRHYRKAVVQKLTDVQIPGVIGYTDRDAIIVRSDLPPEQLIVSRPETHLYGALMSFPVEFLGEDITVLRGWIAVDVNFRGSRFKFVNTHLESPIPGIDSTKDLQVAQAMQLMEDLDDDKLPVILAGDFNSDAEHTNNYPSDNTDSYNYIVASGFSDAWHELRPNDPGFTWSLFPVPEIAFEPFERIDLIFSKGPNPVSVMRTGMAPVFGLYASDHAGVAAAFDLTSHHPFRYGPKPFFGQYPAGQYRLPAHLLKNFRLFGFRRH
jgi:endonuclease/exonuclease/phosphatase family metal-dependent hydrolase